MGYDDNRVLAAVSELERSCGKSLRMTFTGPAEDIPAAVAIPFARLGETLSASAIESPLSKVRIRIQYIEQPHAPSLIALYAA